MSDRVRMLPVIYRWTVESLTPRAARGLADDTWLARQLEARDRYQKAADIAMDQLASRSADPLRGVPRRGADAGLTGWL